MDKMYVYNLLPIWGQNLACYFEGKKIKRTRYGKDFYEKLKEYEDRNSWSYEQRCEYRDKKIKQMITYCYDNVPYYHEIFKNFGIDPESIRCLDDLKKLPILTKDIVNRQPESFLSRQISKSNLITAHTSGTTGAGFIFKTTQQTICEQWAVWWRYRRKLGIQFDMLSGNFGTRFVVPSTQKKPPFWRYNYPCNQVYFSAFHEKSEFLKYYIEEIENKGICWLHGYPSLLSELANEVLNERNETLRKQIKYVTVGAENLLDYQKNAIEKAFGVQVFQHYGLSEGVSNFSEDLEHEIIVDEDFAATEFIKDDGVTKIVGTSLTNYAMPLLRWDTKDTADVIEKEKGRVVTSLDGRIEDYITLPSGKRIGKLDHVFKDAVNLREVQIRQGNDFSINVLYIPRNGDCGNDIKRANELFRHTFGEEVSIEFIKVQAIEKSKSGKLRFIISDLK